MKADRLSRPVLGVLFVAGQLALAGGLAAPEAETVPPRHHPPPAAALPPRIPFDETVEQLDLMSRYALTQAGGVPARSHYCVAMDGGVHPEPPPPRWWKGPRR